MIDQESVDTLNSLANFDEIDKVTPATIRAKCYEIAEALDDIWLSLSLNSELPNCMKTRDGLAYWLAIRGVQQAAEMMKLLSFDITE